MGSNVCSLKYCLPTSPRRALRAAEPGSSQEPLITMQLRQACFSQPHRHLAVPRRALLVFQGNIHLAPGRTERIVACEVEFGVVAPRLRSRQCWGHLPSPCSSAASFGGTAWCPYPNYELHRRAGSAYHRKRRGHASSSKVIAEKKVIETD